MGGFSLGDRFGAGGIYTDPRVLGPLVLTVLFVLFFGQSGKEPYAEFVAGETERSVAAWNTDRSDPVAEPTSRRNGRIPVVTAQGNPVPRGLDPALLAAGAAGVAVLGVGAAGFALLRSRREPADLPS